MLTQEQKNWLKRLNNEDSIKIIPFDPNCHEIFRKIKKEIQALFGLDVKVEHHGATSLQISGQDEIDIYVPVPAIDFESMVIKMKSIFGEVQSLGAMKRARFRKYKNGKKIDFFVVNQDHEEWKNHLKFKSYLQNHPETLEAYRQLKESLNGKSTREYYRVKMEFINEVMEKVK